MHKTNELTYREAGIVAKQMEVPPELEGSPNKLLIRLANLMRALDAYAGLGFKVDSKLAVEVPMKQDQFWVFVGAMEGELIERIDERDGHSVYRYIGEQVWPVPSPIKPYKCYTLSELVAEENRQRKVTN